jgi:lysozyme family protein
MSFAGAVAFVLEREGGFANHVNDRGGPTKYGITHLTLARWRKVPTVALAEVRELRITEAVAIYECNYWRAASCDAIEATSLERLALCVFDAAVNHGPVRAKKFLQQALGVSADGVIGPRTQAALRACDEGNTIDEYLKIRADFFRHIVDADATQRVFLNGWLARCRHVARECGIPIDPSYR